jgi:hypothetical protein
LRPSWDRDFRRAANSPEHALKAWLIGAACVCFLAISVRRELAQTQTAPSSLQVLPARLDFGEQAVGSPGQPATITVTNVSNATVRLQQILTSGIDFTENDDCNKELAPTAQCSIHVFLRPAIPGQRTGSVGITASDPGSPHYVALTGTGSELVRPERASSAGGAPAFNRHKNVTSEEKR